MVTVNVLTLNKNHILLSQLYQLAEKSAVYESFGKALTFFRTGERATNQINFLLEASSLMTVIVILHLWKY